MPELRLVPSGVHRPACLSWEAHLAAAYAELGDFWTDLHAFVERVRFDWQEEQVLNDMAQDPDVRALYFPGEDYPPEAA